MHEQQFKSVIKIITHENSLQKKCISVFNATGQQRWLTLLASIITIEQAFLVMNILKTRLHN
jgi:hypothetical protein